MSRDIMDMNFVDHLRLAEEGLVMAGRQEDEFQAWCENLTALDLSDPETLAVASLKMGVVQIALAGAQVHATIAMVKK